MSTPTFTPRLITCPAEGTAMQKLVHAVLLGHGVANLTVWLPDGNSYDLKVIYVGGDNNVGDTNQLRQ